MFNRIFKNENRCLKKSKGFPCFKSKIEEEYGDSRFSFPLSTHLNLEFRNLKEKSNERFFTGT